MCRKHGSIDKDIDEAIDKHDELYVPDEPVHSSSFTVEDVNDFISKSFENISPVKYQVNKTKVDELTSSWVRYHKQKFEEVLNSVTENYLKRVVPGQEKKFLEILTSNDDSKNDNHEMKLLLDAYKSADSDNQKIMILSALTLRLMLRSKWWEYLIVQGIKLMLLETGVKL